jgi:hypothetical protein
VLPYEKDTKISLSSSLKSPMQSDSALDFQKSIKRDPTAFPGLKDEKQWDNWQRATKALARAQDVYEIFNKNYKPSNPDEVALFERKKIYMYAVAEKTLRTDFGKSCVRKYEDAVDARAVYLDLFTHMESSTKASLDSSKILQYITSAKMGDGSWKGTAHRFVLHWQDQVRQYHKLVPNNDHFSENILLQMLQNAVDPIEELRQVKNQADQHKATSGIVLTY